MTNTRFSKYKSKTANLLALFFANQALATLPVIKLPDVKGTFEATVFIVPLKNDHVRSILPKGLELAPQSSTRTGTHPVLLILGQQKKVRNVMGSATLPYEFNYAETVIAVPYTRLSEGVLPHSRFRGPFYFMPKIFLNNRVPQFLGYSYGFNKSISEVTETPRTYDLKQKELELLSAQFIEQGDFADTERFANFSEVERIFNQPIIGIRTDGFVCSSFDWNLEDVRIQSINGQLKVNSPLINQSMGPFEFKSRGIKNATLGAFKLKSDWTMVGPFSCNSLSKD